SQAPIGGLLHPQCCQKPWPCPSPLDGTPLRHCWAHCHTARSDCPQVIACLPEHHLRILPLVPPPPTVLRGHAHTLCPNTFQRNPRVTGPAASRDSRGSRRFSSIVNPAKSPSIPSGST